MQPQNEEVKKINSHLSSQKNYNLLKPSDFLSLKPILNF